MIYMDYQVGDRVVISASAKELSGDNAFVLRCGAGRHISCNSEGLMAQYAGVEATILCINRNNGKCGAQLACCETWSWCFCQLTPVSKLRVLDWPEEV